MKSVLIIGGGVAGITAAYHLSKSGLNVRILETTNSLGGRITALFDSNSDEMIDNGQHAMMTAYHTFLSMLDDCGASDLLNIQKYLQVSYLDINHKKTRLFTGYLPGKAGFVLGFLMLGGISLKSKISIIKLMKLVEKGSLGSAGQNCQEFLTQNNQGSDAITRFWEPFVIATMNCRLNQASAGILINILRRAFIEDLNNSKLVFPASDLKEIIKPVVKKITDNNTDIIYNCKADKLLNENNKCIGVESAKGEKFFADFIISTLPPYALKKIIPDELSNEFDYLSKIIYSPIVSVYLWTVQEIISEDFAAALGTDIQWIFNRTKLIKKRNSDTYKYSYSITISSADKIAGLKQSEILSLVMNDFKKLISDFDESWVKHSRIITEKFATFIANPETEKIRPDCKTALDNFFLAGDWTNTKLPATIEGASQSGKVAAELILELLN
ncbi:MAG: hydroxysqualene dehydroxylase HpnE [Candidatus Kapabacteria bacterium]|nr:hydroxysqualene dehydroxylase HpnE [Candidatus Kapabacteria bacterium]